MLPKEFNGGLYNIWHLQSCRSETTPGHKHEKLIFSCGQLAQRSAAS